MPYIVFAGVVSLLFGILFLFAPHKIHKMNNVISKFISKTLANFDEKIYNLRVGVGVSLVLISVLCFFVTYFLIKKYG